MHHLGDQHPAHLGDQHLDHPDGLRLDHLDVDLGPPDVAHALRASCLGLAEEHLELPEQQELPAEPCLWTHQMGYYLDAEPLGDPCLWTHQMGYYLDAGLPDAEHLAVELPERLVLSPLELLRRPRPALVEQPEQPVFPQRLALALALVLALELESASERQLQPLPQQQVLPQPSLQRPSSQALALRQASLL